MQNYNKAGKTKTSIFKGLFKEFSCDIFKLLCFLHLVRDGRRRESQHVFVFEQRAFSCHI